MHLWLIFFCVCVHVSPQKNPHAIRLAEERRGLEQLTMSVAVNLSRASQLSSHIHNMCSEAREAVYTREADVKHWLDKGERSTCFCRQLGEKKNASASHVGVSPPGGESESRLSPCA